MEAEQSQFQNINTAPRFVEPHVHPDIDSYLREKLAQAATVKKRDGKLYSERGVARKLDDDYVLDTLARLRQQGEHQVADKFAQVLEIKESDLAQQVIPEDEIQRLQGLWRAAARGDVPALHTLHTEVAQDISSVTDALTERRNSPSSSVREDVERYDTAVAELTEWQASLQETPVHPTTRLGKQINKTVVNLIHQRDNTSMGKLHKQLHQLERVQKTVSTLPNVSTGK